jgi:hypothetical protein
MPKQAVPLTDRKVSTAKPAERDYKLSDGGGIYLTVTNTVGALLRDIDPSRSGTRQGRGRQRRGGEGPVGKKGGHEDEKYW